MTKVMSVNPPLGCCEFTAALNALSAGFAPIKCDCSDRTGPPKEFVQYPKVHQHRGHAEQIGKYGSPGSKKYEKKRANRLRRRAEKADPANAPTRLIRGWND